MGILHFTAVLTGKEGTNPREVYIETDDPIATILEPGYLNQVKAMGYTLTNNDLAHIKATEGIFDLPIMVSGTDIDFQPNLLHADLDVNGFSIVSHDSGDIPITPDGTGSTLITRLKLANNLNTNGYAITNNTANGNVLVNTNGTGLVNFNSTTGIVGVLDEDDMSSNSATHVPTQQSTKAYFDSFIGGASGSLEFIEEKTASSSTSIPFTDLASGSAYYMIQITGMQMSVNGANLQIRTSTDNGSSYDSGASDYQYEYRTITASPTTTADSAADFMEVGGNFGDSSVFANNSLNVYFFDPSQSLRSHDLFWEGTAIQSDGVSASLIGGGKRSSITAVNAMEFFPDSGTISTGSFILYKLKTS